ncbi:glycosyltransferase family 2 protein [Rhizobium sp. CG5]|uniref:glycosyltransferase n=1 Tax=Rhizobium sp. CG5 TaxID=2726076 RepID=UPI0020348304|nr:glycosyltransferase family A protein [Rhizobium sp. CG5]MCM2472752.1 glycosyltransferase family 2 protein [Rhizobium sp. CG5]
MTQEPRLSICVPSRNRQYYFKKTIEGILRSSRTDFELVLVDNSDDPSIMNDYMKEVVKDPRVVYLPSTDRTLSMLDNWERTLEAATGNWVTVIGDDDYIDPDVMIVLRKVVAANPGVEAFAWGALNYMWPSPQTRVQNVMIGFNHNVVKVPRSDSLKGMFGWHKAGIIPKAGFSVYHSAISRPLLEKIKQTFCGRYFEHPTVDYDMAMKVIVTGREFAFCQRPFSVMGSCPESNSFAIGRIDDMKTRVEAFMKELGRNMDEDPELADFPFSSHLGVSSVIGITQQWFKKKYKLNFDGWEKNFAEACARNVEIFREREAFEIVKEGYTAALKKWRRGKFLKYFNPVLIENELGIAISGSNEMGTYIRSDIAGVTTPVELFDIVNAMVMPADMIKVREEGLRYPWDEFMLTIDGERRAGFQPGKGDKRVA